MLDVRFEANIVRDTMDGGEEVSKDVSVSVPRRGDSLAWCRVYVDIIGESNTASNIKIGELMFYAYDADRCNVNLDAEEFEYFDPDEILFELMDDESEDLMHYYYNLEALYEHIKPYDTEPLFFADGLHIIALHRFFIEPDYRGLGIGRFIANNLSKIIYGVANIKPAYVVGCLNPDDKSAATKAIQVKTMGNANYAVVEDEDGVTIFGKCIFDEDII